MSSSTSVVKDGSLRSHRQARQMRKVFCPSITTSKASNSLTRMTYLLTLTFRPCTTSSIAAWAWDRRRARRRTSARRSKLLENCLGTFLATKSNATPAYPSSTATQLTGARHPESLGAAPTTPLRLRFSATMGTGSSGTSLAASSRRTRTLRLDNQSQILLPRSAHQPC